MKRMVGLLLALCTLLSMTAAGAEEYFTYGYILGDDAAAAVMYAQADADSEMVGCLLPGTPVTIIGIRFEKDKEWACIHADHEEREDQVLGYVRREQVGAAAPEVKLVTATLRVLGDPADALDLNSDAGNILRVVVPTGTKAWVWGMMGERYMVQVPEVGSSGTVEMAYVELAEEDQQRIDAVIPEAYKQQYEEQRAAYAAMEAYYNEAAAVYGADTEEWPVEQRAAYCSLNEAAKIYPAWVDLQPRAEDMTQEAARARALQLFQELWNLDATKDDWRVVMAYGYNRMEPKVRLWQVTFRLACGRGRAVFPDAAHGGGRHLLSHLKRGNLCASVNGGGPYGGRGAGSVGEAAGSEILGLDARRAIRLQAAANHTNIRYLFCGGGHARAERFDAGGSRVLCEAGAYPALRH